MGEILIDPIIDYKFDDGKEYAESLIMQRVGAAENQRSSTSGSHPREAG